MSWTITPTPTGQTSSSEELMKMVKLMRYMERKEEAKTKKKEEADKRKKDDEKKKKVEVPKIDIFRGALLLLLLAPVVGPFVLELQVNAFHHIRELLQSLVK